MAAAMKVERRLREAIVEVGRARLPGTLRRLLETAADRPGEPPAELRVHSFKLLARPRAVALVAGFGRARLRLLEAIRAPAACCCGSVAGE